MLASFFYQGEVPDPETILDMARQVLIASTVSNDALDEDVCASMLDGLAAVYVGALKHHRQQEARICDDAKHAERIYLDTAQAVYAGTVKRAYPAYDANDECIWWPDSMRYRDGWPHMFVLGLASTLGEIEGDRSVAVFRYMESQQQQNGAV